MGNTKADKRKNVSGKVCGDSGSPGLKLPVRPGTYVLLALGIGFIVTGALRREFSTIMLNALILCLSCIGIR